eukprot:TRINITY_DN39620_c0_g1_i1.p1 TRINITY_DN39620_c0_g1~~TRINITY_DN39620_c0_g1_i1.p1  ORF type:complete len:635 (+),score=76.46 TRINITY_DN39620_c0_g1_i1:476-2380(+)
MLHSWMKGASAAGWCWLAKFEELRRRVYLYLPFAKEVVYPTDDIPWPIIWWLARYHKKHVFCSNALPKLQNVAQDIRQFINKLKWKYHHRNSCNAPPSISIPFRRLVPPCSAELCPELQAWLFSLHHCLLKAAHFAKARARFNKSHSNLLPLTRLGMKMFRASKWAAVPTDKDGGFAFIDRNSLENVHLQLLQSSMYEELVDPSIAESRYYTRKYCHLAKEIQKLEGEEGLANAIMKSLTDTAKLPARLSITCKSHKPAGEVSFRNIHANAQYMFAGLSAWCASQLRRLLVQHQHLIPDSRTFVRQLKLLTADADSYFIKLDVKDFYMSGTADELVNDAVGLMASGQRKELTKEALQFLLSTQFVTSELHELQGRVWKVLRGSGMGLKHSGDLADSALLFKAEHAWACNRDVMNFHGIQAYWRFRDDILIIATDPKLSLPYVTKFMSSAGYFKVLCERVSRTEVRFLDVRVWKQGVAFLSAPTWKPTSLGIPLCLSSAHPPHVHSSWPVGLIKRLGSLASRAADAENAKKILIARFKNHLASPAILHLLEATPTWGKPRRQHACQQMQHDQPVQWLTLGYHPALRLPMHKALRRFLENVSMNSLYMFSFQSSAPVVRISWRNHLPNMCTLVARS